MIIKSDQNKSMVILNVDSSTVTEYPDLTQSSRFSTLIVWPSEKLRRKARSQVGRHHQLPRPPLKPFLSKQPLATDRIRA